VANAGIHTQQGAVEFDVFVHRYARQTTNAPVYRGSYGDAAAEMLVMARPRVVRIGIKHLFKLGGEVLIGAIVQVAGTQGRGHVRPLCRTRDNTPSHGVRALSYRVERGDDPGWGHAGIAVCRANHAARTTAGDQATACFIHE